MKQIIMGTAGHVDHGKTTLVKALSGIDCDTHPEEKRRGITINLGFAHLDLPDGNRISIIDVPGHRDFVHTMVSGASGIDFALLVIAADDGIMPQTREHLQIMQVLGVRTGIIALTRIDLVDAETLALAHDETVELTKNTFLHGCPIIPVSAISGVGIAELMNAIAGIQTAIEKRSRGEVFRLFIDRIFTVAGFGAVVTGSVLGGELKTGDHAWLLPAGRELRIRRMERHGEETTIILAGDRASINLVGLNRDEYERGMLIADRPLRSTMLLDAELQLFGHAGEIGIWTQANFLLGTFEAQVRIHLIEGNRAGAESCAIVQIHLPRPVIAQNSDRFVIRNSSNDITLGGGQIIDAFPLHHRRRPPELLENLKTIAQGKLPERIAAEARKRSGAVDVVEVAEILNVSREQVEAGIQNGLPSDILILASEKNDFIIAQQATVRIEQSIVEDLTSFHRRNPLVAEGRTVDELAGIVGAGANGSSWLYPFVNLLCTKGLLQRTGISYSLGSHQVTIPETLKRQIDTVDHFLLTSGMHAPSLNEMNESAAKAGVDEKTLKQILRFLTGSKKALLIDGSYIHGAIVNQSRAAFLNALEIMPSGMTVAQFRDLINGNRKICLMMLSLFDNEEIVSRQGDLRFITPKGRTILKRKATEQ